VINAQEEIFEMVGPEAGQLDQKQLFFLFAQGWFFLESH